MPVSVADISQAVRRVVADVAWMELEEVTLETHVYDELGLDSVGFVELFIALEEEFGIEMDEGTLAGYDPDTEGVTWEECTYRINVMFRAYLTAGALPLDAASRAGEIIKLSARHGVRPFSVGFVCAWLVEILNAAPSAEDAS